MSPCRFPVNPAVQCQASCLSAWKQWEYGNPDQMVSSAAPSKCYYFSVWSLFLIPESTHLAAGTAHPKVAVYMLLSVRADGRHCRPRSYVGTVNLYSWSATTSRCWAWWIWCELCMCNMSSVYAFQWSKVKLYWPVSVYSFVFFSMLIGE